ncbi:hypothetical protein NPIL_544971 [Nephila pilipes]|uniref:Uncharacterized protein n=1 Tax=Nephila pilipes TaxID=299642 RepID=A0A8X6Q0F0_NEPPI|nr:hypothetical protein NPIL_544971 [Nephila pilipes]
MLEIPMDVARLTAGVYIGTPCVETQPSSSKSSLRWDRKITTQIDLTGAESECPIEENCGDPMETSTSYGDGYLCLEEGCTFL